MKRLILCFLLLAGFTAQAQELTAFKDASGKYGYKDKSGKIIVQPKYDLAWDFSEGLAMVVLRKKYGFIDESGNEVIPLTCNMPIFLFKTVKSR